MPHAAAGDLQGQAWALNQLGIALELTGDYAGAAASQTKALPAVPEDRRRARPGRASNQLGLVQWLTGDYAGAAVSQAKALQLFQKIGDQQGEALGPQPTRCDAAANRGL